MDYLIVMGLDNAAFADDDQEGNEIARILRKLADRCESQGGACVGLLTDINGNRVGHTTTTP